MIIGPAIGAYTMATPIGYLATAAFGVGLSAVTLVAMMRSRVTLARIEAAAMLKLWLSPRTMACCGSGVAARRIRPSMSRN